MQQGTGGDWDGAGAAARSPHEESWQGFLFILFRCCSVLALSLWAEAVLDTQFQPGNAGEARVQQWLSLGAVPRALPARESCLFPICPEKAEELLTWQGKKWPFFSP